MRDFHGVLAVFATGGLLSLGSLVGFVTLFGITIRNSILLVSHYEHLVSVDGHQWGLETALLTSTVLNLLVLPTLALRFGRFQREAERVA